MSVRKIVSKTRQKASAFVAMNHQSPLKSLLSEGFCEFLTKEMQAPTHIPRLFSAASPAKRVRFGKEEQRNERALTFEKSRSKRYGACSDVE